MISSKHQAEAGAAVVQMPIPVVLSLLSPDIH
jgi:hypothetical protein